MERELKKSYKCLDLPYNATAEEVETRQKALTKMLSVESEKRGISCEKELMEIQIASKMILENIKNNGIPQEEYHKFQVSNESIISLLIIFFFVGVICVFSFILL